MTARTTDSINGVETILSVVHPPASTDIGLKGAFHTSFSHLAVITSSLTAAGTPDVLKSSTSFSAVELFPLG
jgi:hypothetical protein